MYFLQRPSSLRYYLLLILCGLIISNCTPKKIRTAPIKTPDVSIPIITPKMIVDDANKLYQEGQLQAAATGYATAANMYSSPKKERLLLQAAEISASLRNPFLTRHYLSAIKPSTLTSSLHSRYQYILGLLALLKDEPLNALKQLPSQFKGIPNDLLQKIMSKRVEAAQKSNNKQILLLEHIKQDPYMPPTQQQSNQVSIWKQLGQLSDNELDQLRRQERHASTVGWLDLAYIDRLSSKQTNINLNFSLDKWKLRFNNHPALNYAKPLLNKAKAQQHALQKKQLQPITKKEPSPPTKKTSKIKKIAVLLPLSGGMKNVGESITRGIKSAHPSSQLYDTNLLDSSVQYNAASDQLMDIILGPFSKSGLQSIAQNGYLPIPTISLNYLPSKSAIPKNLYQFGLLPEDEVIQMAYYAKKMGKRRALLIAPKGPWGTRLITTFHKLFTENGGTIAHQVYYDNNNIDKAAATLLKHNADMIFMIASPKQARLLYPSLQLVNTKKLPILSTSHIFSGNLNPIRDKVLDGILYTEIPWILTTAQKHPSQLTKRYPRLFALGQDAIKIAYQLEAVIQGQRIKGKTGILSLTADKRFHRTLVISTFKLGIPIRAQ